MVGGPVAAGINDWYWFGIVTTLINLLIAETRRQMHAPTEMWPAPKPWQMEHVVCHANRVAAVQAQGPRAPEVIAWLQIV